MRKAQDPKTVPGTRLRHIETCFEVVYDRERTRSYHRHLVTRDGQGYCMPAEALDHFEIVPDPTDRDTVG